MKEGNTGGMRKRERWEKDLRESDKWERNEKEMRERERERERERDGNTPHNFVYINYQYGWIFLYRLAAVFFNVRKP